MEGGRSGGKVPSDTSDANELRVASINVNGMRAAVKRRSFFDRLRRGKYDICLIQEIHSTPGESGIWRSEWGGPAYFCHGSSNSRGVVILLNRNLAYKVLREIADEDGRILLQEIRVNEVTYVVGSLYAPTADAPDEQNRFMDSLEEKMATLHPINTILGSDLNVALDPVQDRNNNARSPTYGDVMRQRVHTLMEQTDLTDAWRYRNPAVKKFTFHRPQQASRIDYWLISDHLTDACSGVDITPLALSDHSLLTLTLGTQAPRRGPGLWRLDNAILGDSTYVEEISHLLEVFGFRPLCQVGMDEVQGQGKVNGV